MSPAIHIYIYTHDIVRSASKMYLKKRELYIQACFHFAVSKIELKGKNKRQILAKPLLEH